MQAHGLIGAVVAAAVFYLLLNPEKVRRKVYLMAAFGGLKVIALSAFFLAGRSSDVVCAGQILYAVGLFAALVGAGGAAWPWAIPVLEKGPPPGHPTTPGAAGQE